MSVMSEEEVRIRQSIVDNLAKKVEFIEGQRKKKNRKLGQKDVEAIKGIGRDIALGKI